MTLEDTLTAEEIRDFMMFDKVLSTHSSQQVYELFCEDMTRRHGYKDQDELMDRYVIFAEQYKPKYKK